MVSKFNKIRLILSKAPELHYDQEAEKLYVVDSDGLVYRYDEITLSVWLLIKSGDLDFFDKISDWLPSKIVANIPKTKKLDFFPLPSPSVVMWKVDSSNIDYVGYDSQTRRLYVQFLTGAVYVYYDVEPEIWNGLRQSNSKGSFLHWFIKVNKYQYNTVGGFLLDYTDNYLSPNSGTPHPDGYLTGFSK